MHAKVYFKTVYEVLTAHVGQITQNLEFIFVSFHKHASMLSCREGITTKWGDLLLIQLYSTHLVCLGFILTLAWTLDCLEMDNRDVYNGRLSVQYEHVCMKKCEPFKTRIKSLVGLLPWCSTMNVFSSLTPCSEENTSVRCSNTRLLSRL